MQHAFNFKRSSYTVFEVTDFNYKYSKAPLIWTPKGPRQTVCINVVAKLCGFTWMMLSLNFFFAKNTVNYHI